MDGDHGPGAQNAGRPLQIHDVELVVDRLQVNDDEGPAQSECAANPETGKDLMFVAVAADAAPAKTFRGKSPGDEGDSRVKKPFPMNWFRIPNCSCAKTLGSVMKKPSPTHFSLQFALWSLPGLQGTGYHFSCQHGRVDSWILRSASAKEDRSARRKEREPGPSRHRPSPPRISSLTKPVKGPAKEVAQHPVIMAMKKARKQILILKMLQFDPQAPFEGIVNILKRWFNNGYSEGLREWAEVICSKTLPKPVAERV